MPLGLPLLLLFLILVPGTGYALVKLELYLIFLLFLFLHQSYGFSLLQDFVVLALPRADLGLDLLVAFAPLRFRTIFLKLVSRRLVVATLVCQVLFALFL